MSTPIVNNDAGPDSANSYEICQYSGFRAKRGGLVQDPFTKAWVLPEFVDKYPDQLRVRAVAESLTGPIRPEPASENFIDSISDGSTL